MRAVASRRSYVVLWKMARIYPPPWSAAFREPSFVLARAALRHDAAQKIREFTALIRFLGERRLRVVVEIGSDRGGTLYTWCRLAEADATIVCIDLPAGPFSRGETDLHALAERYKRERQAVHVLLGDSHDPHYATVLPRPSTGSLSTS